MLVEKSKKEALKAFASGRRVLLIPEVQKSKAEGTWLDLDTVIGEGQFLVDVPAIENQEFEDAVQETGIAERRYEVSDPNLAMGEPEYITEDEGMPPPSNEVRK